MASGVRPSTRQIRQSRTPRCRRSTRDLHPELAAWRLGPCGAVLDPTAPGSLAFKFLSEPGSSPRPSGVWARHPPPRCFRGHPSERARGRSIVRTQTPNQTARRAALTRRPIEPAFSGPIRDTDGCLFLPASFRTTLTPGRRSGPTSGSISSIRCCPALSGCSASTSRPTGRSIATPVQPAGSFERRLDPLRSERGSMTETAGERSTAGTCCRTGGRSGRARAAAIAARRRGRPTARRLGARLHGSVAGG
jgi:hypothetical protein